MKNKKRIKVRFPTIETRQVGSLDIPDRRSGLITAPEFAVLIRKAARPASDKRATHPKAGMKEPAGLD